MTDLAIAAAHYQAMLDALGLAGDDRTALRHVRALAEMTNGGDPADHLSVQFPPVCEGDTQLITVTGVPFTSMCEHHMLPFWGQATIGYLPKPGGRIVGLSKLPRALQEIARRPQTQERIGAQLVDAIMANLDAIGAAVTLRATHSCMALRGARTGTDSTMATTLYRGDLAGDPYRAEFATIAAAAPPQRPED